MELSNANAPLFAALAAAQAEVENAIKGNVNPHFKSRYADLAEVLNTVRPVFARHGLSILQSTAFDGVNVSVTTTLAHAEGGWVSSCASCVPARVDAQGIGAATTYLRRYSLAAMAGVAQEDDDGNAASHQQRPAQESKREDGLLPATLEIAQKQLDRCEDMDALGKAWATLPANVRKALGAHKDKCKQRLQEASHAAA
jgi:ERF superfamily